MTLIRPMTGLHTCISYEEFAGQRATIEEFRKFLLRFNREQVVLATCIVNACLGSWGGTIDAKGHEALVQEAFYTDDAKKLLQACKSPTGDRFVFHRQQVLFVAKEATLSCKEGGIDPMDAPHWGGLGMAFLMANDLMGTETSEPKTRPDETLLLLAQLITVGEFSGRYIVANRVARSHLMLTKFFPAVSKGKLDLVEEFKKETRLDMQLFISVCIAIITFYMTHSFEVLKKKPGVIMHVQFWDNVKIDRTVVTTCLNELAGTLGEIKSKFLERDRGGFDMTGFRSRPLVRHSNGGFYAPDLQFVIQKLESGVFWKVHDSLSNKDLLHSLWGEAFEQYVNWMISEMVDGKVNKFIPSPRFKNTGDQVCDGIIVCGHRAIFIEYKGRTFRADAKYSGDSDVLRKEIDRHLVGTLEKPKGVFQLANAIRKAFDRKQPMEIEGVDVSNISKVFPVLLTRDDLGGSFVLSHYLNLKFEPLLYKRHYRPIKIAPVFALSIEGMELISGYLKEVPLASVFESWYMRDRALFSCFVEELSHFTKPLGDRRNLNLWSVFDTIMNDASATLFGPKDPPKTSSLLQA